MKTPQEYVESLRKLDLVVYMFGKKLDNVVDDPIIRPSLNAVAMTYSLAMDPRLPGAHDRHLAPHREYRSTASPTSTGARRTW